MSLPTPSDLTVSSFDYLNTLLGAASLLLGAIGILIAVLALPVFFYLKYRAEKIAKDTSREFLREMETEAISRMEIMLPGLVSDYMDFIKGSVSDSAANEIAEAQSLEVNGDANSGGNPPGAD